MFQNGFSLLGSDLTAIPPELVVSLGVFPPAVLLLLSPVCSILICVAIIGCLALCDFDTHPVKTS